MASTQSSEKGRIATQIIECGESVFDPQKLQNGKPVDDKPFRDLIESTGTLVLLPALNALIQTGRCQPWLRPHLVRALSHLPLRPQGVRQTIEFVLAVHPSTSLPSNGETAAPGTRGANISLEALNAASRLLSTPPRDLTPDQWFEGVGPQLLALLDGEGGPEMAKAVAFIIGYGVLGKRAIGAPGTSGWKAFVEPILGRIDPNQASTPLRKDSDELIIDFSARNTIITAQELEAAILRLTVLLTSHPNPGLAKRLISKVALPLWALECYLNERPSDSVPKQAQALLKTFLQLANSETVLKVLIQNLLFVGNVDQSKLCWCYKISNEGIQVEKVPEVLPRQLDLGLIDTRVNSFVTLLETTKEVEGVDTIFLSMCRGWLQMSHPESNQILFTESGDKEDYEAKIIEAKLLQAMMERIPAKLVENSSQLLQLVLDVLTNYIRGRTQANIETATIALSLVNFVVTSPKFRVDEKNQSLVNQLQETLDAVAKQGDAEVSTTARNLSMLLSFRSTEDPDGGDQDSPAIDRHVEDQRTYKLALSYLTGTDSPPPVRVQGLDLICGLIKANSPVLDVPALLILFASTLQDNEDYVYLRSIECFVLLSAKHPRSVMGDLSERFVDANEDYQLDARLRIGEALIRVIEKTGYSFYGDIARKVGEALLSVAGRRAHKSKAEKEEAKRERLQAKQKKQAELAGVGQISDDEEDESLTERQLEDNAILRSIVEGWGSKRGSEDIRIRSSALSILATGIETNAAGIGSSIIGSAVDVSVNILAVEREPATAILRRSAMLVFMSLIRAMDTAKEHDAGKRAGSKPSLSFNLAGPDLEQVLAILRYVADTDSDGLVRQHAKDVIEGFEAYQQNDILRATSSAAAGGFETELTELRGLQVRPVEEPGIRRPKIEEIE